jgi:hypothetical protein
MRDGSGKGGFLVPRAVKGCVLALALLLVSPAGAQAASFTVNSTTDNAPNPTECSGAAGDCSLRQAIDKSNRTSSDDVITLPAGDYKLTITGANETNDQTGDLNVNKGGGTLTVNGAGAHSTAIDATGLGDRVLRVEPDSTASISGVTITGGTPTTGFNNDGGGIRNDGTLTLIDSTVTGNTSALGEEGGGIGNPDDVSITLSGDTIVNNQSGDHGGGIDIFTGSASIANTTITNNNAPSHGGGVDVDTGVRSSSPTTRFTATPTEPKAAVWGSTFAVE